MKVAVIGSRGFTNYSFLSKKLSQFSISKIISGGAHGADSLARRYALENHIACEIFKPEYSLYGRFAPLVRNERIISNAEFVVAFWDGTSSGTAHALRLARDRGLVCHVFNNW